MNSDLQERATGALNKLVTSRIDRGAQAAVYRDGELVADAWAGEANPFTREPVTGETLFPVFSVTKGFTATVIHRLVDRGLLSYSTRLVDLWPEYGARGKEKTTLRHALEHTAGVPELPADLTFEAMLDWPRACEALAAAAPKWRPGKLFAYHAKTYGWLLGEVARRADGREFGVLVREEIAEPLGLDSLHVGLPAGHGAQVAFLEETDLGPVPAPHFAELAPTKAATVPSIHQMNTPQMQAACLPSSNGLMNARAIAKHYAALLRGGVDGVRLLPSKRLAAATRWKTFLDPEGQQTVRGLGYMRVDVSVNGRTYEGLGHGGYGGSMGFAFPELRLAIGYTRNKLNGPGGWETLARAVFDGV